MRTKHLLVVGDSRSLAEIEQHRVPIHLVVTSPPYPMIEMWDAQFRELGAATYREMHDLLGQVWEQCHGVLVDGGLMCINIGDATRRNDGSGFRLYPNHTQIVERCEKLGFTPLPYVLWKKPTNKPNAFLGSGFLPPNAYVTLDCEYVLIFRKGQGRKFPAKDPVRYDSSFTKEERDKWFSQIWADIRGAKQTQQDIARRTAAFPEELVGRLIRMFSVKGDNVLDPFVGTGTTMRVAKDLKRNSIGYELDDDLGDLIVRAFQQKTLDSEFEVIRRPRGSSVSSRRA